MPSIIAATILCIAWKGRPRNDLYGVGWDVKLNSLTHSNHFVKQPNHKVAYITTLPAYQRDSVKPA